MLPPYTWDDMRADRLKDLYDWFHIGDRRADKYHAAFRAAKDRYMKLWTTLATRTGASKATLKSWGLPEPEAPLAVSGVGQGALGGGGFVVPMMPLSTAGGSYSDTPSSESIESLEELGDNAEVLITYLDASDYISPPSSSPSSPPSYVSDRRPSTETMNRLRESLESLGDTREEVIERLQNNPGMANRLLNNLEQSARSAANVLRRRRGHLYSQVPLSNFHAESGYTSSDEDEEIARGAINRSPSVSTKAWNRIRRMPLNRKLFFILVFLSLLVTIGVIRKDWGLTHRLENAKKEMPKEEWEHPLLTLWEISPKAWAHDILTNKQWRRFAEDHVVPFDAGQMALTGSVPGFPPSKNLPRYSFRTNYTAFWMRNAELQAMPSFEETKEILRTEFSKDVPDTKQVDKAVLGIVDSFMKRNAYENVPEWFRSWVLQEKFDDLWGSLVTHADFFEFVKEKPGYWTVSSDELGKLLLVGADVSKSSHPPRDVIEVCQNCTARQSPPAGQKAGENMFEVIGKWAATRSDELSNMYNWGRKPIYDTLEEAAESCAQFNPHIEQEDIVKSVRLAQSVNPHQLTTMVHDIDRTILTDRNGWAVSEDKELVKNLMHVKGNVENAVSTVLAEDSMDVEVFVPPDCKGWWCYRGIGDTLHFIAQSTQDRFWHLTTSPSVQTIAAGATLLMAVGAVQIGINNHMLSDSAESLLVASLIVPLESVGLNVWGGIKYVAFKSVEAVGGSIQSMRAHLPSGQGVVSLARSGMGTLASLSKSGFESGIAVTKYTAEKAVQAGSATAGFVYNAGGTILTRIASSFISGSTSIIAALIAGTITVGAVIASQELEKRPRKKQRVK